MKLNIVKIIPVYAKSLHSELISFCITVLTSLTSFKTKVAISAQSFLCLHNKYTVRVVASSEITAEIT